MGWEKSYSDSLWQPHFPDNSHTKFNGHIHMVKKGKKGGNPPKSSPQTIFGTYQHLRGRE